LCQLYQSLKISQTGIALTLSEKSYNKFLILQQAFNDLKKSIKENDKNFYKT
jgi:hypothetical protein